jgi:hypothetical protein
MLMVWTNNKLDEISINLLAGLIQAKNINDEFVACRNYQADIIKHNLTNVSNFNNLLKFIEYISTYTPLRNIKTYNLIKILDEKTRYYQIINIADLIAL